MMYELLLLLLPIAAVSGWYIGRFGRADINSRTHLSRDYFVGLNYLLDEQPDKAVDVFIKVLEVDSETVETHLALGNLFRRRGEVDRAIRIHQNLIARPSLAKLHRVQALLALGQDYQKAGVLDRAERLFLQVVDMGEYAAESLQYLLEIYQQQKNWERAILIAAQYEALAGERISKQIAHYYCELADIARMRKENDIAHQQIKNALKVDSNCVRASFLMAEMKFVAGQFKEAIQNYQQVKQQDPEYLSETLMPLVTCYEAMDGQAELMNYLLQCLQDYPRISIVLVIADQIQKQQGDRAAIEFIAHQLHQQPSLRGLKRLIALQLVTADAQSRENLVLLQELTASLLKNKPIYRCEHCGFGGRTLYWQCPGCKNWGSVKPIHGLEGD